MHEDIITVTKFAFYRVCIIQNALYSESDLPCFAVFVFRQLPTVYNTQILDDIMSGKIQTYLIICLISIN